MKRPKLRPLPPLPLSGTKKRPILLETSPQAPSPKRQRFLPSEAANLPQAKIATGPSRRLGKLGPEIPRVVPEGSALNLSLNRPTFDEKMDGDHAGVRQSKGTELRINTQVAQSAAPLPPRTEIIGEEELYTVAADFVTNHEEFCKQFVKACERADKYKAKNQTLKQKFKLLERRFEASENSIREKGEEIDEVRRELQQYLLENRHLKGQTTRCYL